MNRLDFVKAALAEDVGRGDLFAKVAKKTPAKAYVTAKSSGVLAGQCYVKQLQKLYDIDLKWQKNDGEHFEKGEKLLLLSADSHTLMALERTILNMMLHASSIATLTDKFVAKIKPYGTILLDTRKTRPHLRVFEKYAVRCGGGVNHRMGLDDSLMLKDTHLKTIANLKEFIAQARQKIPFTAKIEVECEDFDSVKTAFAANADIVMCDNMDNETIAKIVQFRNENYPHILLEASGNVTLETIEAIAKTGVDAISTGATVHQANWIDLSMKVE
jgi:nicotinate-nucleotide pyrophosphorylase (carboxylating)